MAVLSLYILLSSIYFTIVGAVTLEASCSTIETSGDIVIISWRDLESPTELDWLGIYTPPESLDDHFIGYVLLSSVSGWEIGNGSYAFPAVNMRAPYEFRLFLGYPPSTDTPLDQDRNPLPSTKTRLAISPAVGFSNYNEPTQVHLALTSNPSEMSVLFVTKDPVSNHVKYGRASDKLFSTVVSQKKTYQQKDMCDVPANTTVGWRDPGYIHSAIMIGLEPRVRYFYQVGSIETGWSVVYSFVASYVGGEDTNALLFGDMGTYVPYKTLNWVQPESVNTMKWLQRDLDQLGDRPTLVSHIGDISYARGYSWLWDNFFTQVQPVAARAPWHVCVGNHEYDWLAQPWKPEWAPYGKDSGGECGVPYSLRFQMPGTSSLPVRSDVRGVPETKNLYYSLDFGLVHFVYISTETNFLPGSDQYDWIVQDLKTTDRQKTPFIVFQGHRPMYSTDNKAMKTPFTKVLLEHLEPLLIENKVSLALWGHVHKYERTCPLQNLTCMDSSAKNGELFPVHMVIGMGGQDWQPIDQPRLERPMAPIFPQPAWSLYRSFEFGYIRLHATRSLMTVSYVGNHDGHVHDVVEFLSPSDVRSFKLLENRRVNKHSSSSLKSSTDSHINSYTIGDKVYGVFHLAMAFVLGAGLTGIAVSLFAQRAAEKGKRVVGTSSQTR